MEWHRQVVLTRFNPMLLLTIVNRPRFGFWIKQLGFIRRDDGKYLVKFTIGRGVSHLRFDWWDTHKSKWRMKYFRVYNKLSWRNTIRLLWLLVRSEKYLS